MKRDLQEKQVLEHLSPLAQVSPIRQQQSLEQSLMTCFHYYCVF